MFSSHEPDNGSADIELFTFLVSCKSVNILQFWLPYLVGQFEFFAPNIKLEIGDPKAQFHQVLCNCMKKFHFCRHVDYPILNSWFLTSDSTSVEVLVFELYNS